MSAKERGMSLMDFFREAAKFYSPFPKDLLKDIKTVADSLQLPVQTVIAHILSKRSAFDYAWLHVFGTQPPGFFKEFRFDEDGLVTGERLLKQLTDESIELLKNMKTKLENSQKTGKSEVINKEAMAIFHASL